MNIGIDLISVGRFKNLKVDDFANWNKTFKEQEWLYAFKDVHSAEHLAGIFAVKEAAIKVFGLADSASFGDFEVHHDSLGKPFLNIENVAVSVSHSQEHAVAVVLLY